MLTMQTDRNKQEKVLLSLKSNSESGDDLCFRYVSTNHICRNKPSKTRSNKKALKIHSSTKCDQSAAENSPDKCTVSPVWLTKISAESCFSDLMNIFKNETLLVRNLKILVLSRNQRLLNWEPQEVRRSSGTDGHVGFILHVRFVEKNKNIEKQEWSFFKQ